MRRRKETEHEILTGTIEGWEKEVWLFIVRIHKALGDNTPKESFIH